MSRINCNLITWILEHHSLEENNKYWYQLGVDYMRWAGPISRAGSVCQDVGKSVKHTKNQLHDYMEKKLTWPAGIPVSWYRDPSKMDWKFTM